jgi:hypothetical protein
MGMRGDLRVYGLRLGETMCAVCGAHLERGVFQCPRCGNLILVSRGLIPSKTAEAAGKEERLTIAELDAELEEIEKEFADLDDVEEAFDESGDLEDLDG